jgi:hypothetical protein
MQSGICRIINFTICIHNKLQVLKVDSSIFLLYDPGILCPLVYTDIAALAF